MIDNDQQRDYAEEVYVGAFCPACGDSPCHDEGGHQDEADWDAIEAELRRTDPGLTR